MKPLLVFSRGMDAVSAVFGRIADWMVLASCVISAGNAAIRYGFSMSSNAWLEVQWYLFAGVVMLGASYTLERNEHVRVDLVYGSVGARARRAMIIAAAAAVVVLYGMSLPAVVDYVTFMKVQETAYLDIRFDYLWAIYVVFAVASIVRYLWLSWRAMRSDGVAAPDPRDTTSGI